MKTHKKQPISQYVKEFFRFTKWKTITFVVLALLWLKIGLDLRGDFLLNDWILVALLAIVVVIIYLLLSTIWFACISKKHLTIGMVILVIILSTLNLSHYISGQRYERIQQECMRESAFSTTTAWADFATCMESREKIHRFWK
jgi:hypothetical protein